jgi:hypothetical protein
MAPLFFRKTFLHNYTDLTITVYDDKLTIEFKSGVEVDV